MNIEVYIWRNASKYSVQQWRKLSKNRIEFNTRTIHANRVNSIKQIVINHHLKQYRKNFDCSTLTLKHIIDDSKDRRPGFNYMTLV